MKMQIDNSVQEISNVKRIHNVGASLNFSASEAYKRLRTNIFFSLQKKEDDKGFAIGITSSIRGEGKSTTSINTAYALAESGKRVILLECDMRLPVLAKNLKAESEPGLSNLIVGLCSKEEAIKPSGIQPNLDIIPAGSIPPNPSELLGTKRFKDILKSLEETYDFVVVDLPPISSVSDALVVAGEVDGMIVVVRHSLCTQSVLGETMRQLNVVKDKIMGFVYNGATDENKKYSKKYYKYGYGYGYGYGKKNHTTSSEE
ncbi:MAG: CpsD/CapB family tyrosine-protein kinase [Acutalibacteraceae bacterium]